MSEAERYQLLDQAGDESFLWDCCGAIHEVWVDGRTFVRHQQRTPAQLRPELERLLHAGQIEMYEVHSNALLSCEDALKVIADDHNWFSPLALGVDEEREKIYSLALSNSGLEELRRLHGASGSA